MRLTQLALCCSCTAALVPPVRIIAAKPRTRLNAAQLLPTEACVALLYVAPLPPVGTVIGRRWRRIRGAAVDTGPLVAPPRDKNTRRYALLVLAYALRAAAKAPHGSDGQFWLLRHAPSAPSKPAGCSCARSPQSRSASVTAKVARFAAASKMAS